MGERLATRGTPHAFRGRVRPAGTAIRTHSARGAVLLSLPGRGVSPETLRSIPVQRVPMRPLSGQLALLRVINVATVRPDNTFLAPPRKER
jgi:hypothetical protein